MWAASQLHPIPVVGTNCSAVRDRSPEPTAAPNRVEEAVPTMLAGGATALAATGSEEWQPAISKYAKARDRDIGETVSFMVEQRALSQRSCLARFIAHAGRNCFMRESAKKHLSSIV